jgi:hypothetical protein
MSSVGKTIVFTPFSLLFVFGCFWIITSNNATGKEDITTWSTTAGTQLQRFDSGWSTRIHSEKTVLAHQIRDKSLNYSEFVFDLYLEKTLIPQVLVAFELRENPDMVRWYPLPGVQIRRTGWNRVVVPFDMDKGFFSTNRIFLSLTSPQGPNLVGIRDARLVAHSRFDRLRRMLQASFRHQPLNQRSNNFVETHFVVGRGPLFVFWLALIVGLLSLPMRRFLLRERFSLVHHAVITLVVLVVLAELRNGADYFRNLRDAAAFRFGSRDLVEHLGRHEMNAHGIAWFGDGLRYLRQIAKPGDRITVASRYVPGISEAMRRLAYYADPALFTAQLDTADIALCFKTPSKQLDQSSDWDHVQTVAEDLIIFKRIR